MARNKYGDEGGRGKGVYHSITNNCIMKTLLSKTSLFIICIVCSLTVMAQNDPDKIDSLKKVLLTEKEDTNKVNTLLNLSFEYLNKNDTLNFLTSLNLDLDLSKKISYKLGEGKAFRTFAAYYLLTNQYEEGLKNGSLALKIFKELNNQSRTADVYSVIAAAYFELGIYGEAIKNDYLALKIYEELNDKEGIGKSAQGIA
jgi:tetratricopeptide (TPR) repeat protein